MAHFYWEGLDKNGSEYQGAAESQNLVEAKEETAARWILQDSILENSPVQSEQGAWQH